MTRRGVSITAAVLLVLALAAQAAMVRKLDQLRAEATLEEVLYIPSAKAIRRLSLNHTGLAANVYWTRAVQYFGAKHGERSMRYDLLWPLLDITTDLDPNLLVAYEFGSIFLAQQPPEGAGQPEKAVDLVEKGIRQNPEAWRLYYTLGFIHYIEREDYQAASDAFLRGSRVPGAHPWLGLMAAMAAQHGGKLSTARFLWENIYKSTQDEAIRDNALKRLRAIKVEEDVIALEEIIQTYTERTGHRPFRWSELISAGAIRGVPVDPLGRPYRLESDGTVTVQSSDVFPFLRRGLPKGESPPPKHPLLG